MATSRQRQGVGQRTQGGDDMAMRAVEFEAQLDEHGSVRLPPEIAGDVPRDRPVRVIVLVPEPDEERHWVALAAQQFAAGYDSSDSIYDDLPAR